MKFYQLCALFSIVQGHTIAEKYPGQQKDLKDPSQRANIKTAEHYNMTQEDQDLILQRHNYYRALHEDTGGVTWNDTLASYAASFVAAYDCASGELSHSVWDFGENIALGYNVAGSVKGWYDEIKDYDFIKSEFSGATGHFTQLLWKDTKQVGCAIRYCNSFWGNITVCEYDPAGNWDGEFRENVRPLISKEKIAKISQKNDGHDSELEPDMRGSSNAQETLEDAPITITLSSPPMSVKDITTKKEKSLNSAPTIAYEGLAPTTKPTYLLYIMFFINCFV